MNRVTMVITEGQNYYHSNKKRIWTVGVCILILLTVFSVGMIAKTVTAQRYANRVKLVTSIEVKRGDTLWSIASEYMSDEYDDMNDYIEEIKSSNGMDSDEVRAGNFIIVPYFADIKD